MRKTNYLIILILYGLIFPNANSQNCTELRCTEAIRVSVGIDCEAEIIPDYFVLPDCISGNYQIDITDLAGNPVPNPITSEYFYTDLMAKFISFDLDDTCTTNLIVEDRLHPEINDISGPAILTCLSNLDEDFTVDATDNCDFITEITDINYSCEDCDVITVEITWTVTDIGGNQDSRTLVKDLIGFWDVIVWPPDYIISCEGELPSVASPIINDQPGCDRTYEIEYYDYKTGCTINRIWIITDVGSGLQTSYSQHISINDIIEPVIIADDEIHLSLKEYNAGWSFDYDVVDDCTVDPIVYVSQDIFPISCNPEYFKIIYTVTAFDDCGNQATHQTVVHVKSPFKAKAKLTGKKSCYSPFLIYTQVKNMAPPFSYSYTLNNFTWSVTDLGNGRARVFPGIGKVVITVEVTDQAGCKAVDKIRYNCRKYITNSRSFESEELGFYPNPTTGNLYITGDEVQEVMILNLEGKLLRSYKNLLDNQLDVSDLNAGIYMIKIKTAVEEISLKMIKI